MATPFDYRTASLDEVLAQAHGLEGRSLDSLGTGLDLRAISSAHTKGLVGMTYETYFGIPANTRAEADFVGAGLELKSVPIVRDGSNVRAKERVSLGMINQSKLGIQEWETAGIRQKLDSLLLVFYEWRAEVPIGRFVTLKVTHWRPDPIALEIIRADWTLVRDLVRVGRGFLISESTGRIVGAATKGPGGQADPNRRTRAWALKPAFVASIFGTSASRAPLVSLADAVSPGRPLDMEPPTVALLGRFYGRSIASIADEMGIPPSRSKSFAATVVRKVLGLPSRGKFKEGEWFGLEVKTVPMSPGGSAYEDTSFPAFKHGELVGQAWEDSDLLTRLTRILFIPLIRDRRKDPLVTARLGRAFFWTPTGRQLDGIRSEWEDFRDRITVGEAERLPTAKDTEFVHVRPKARTGSDTEEAPGGVVLTKKCFWLNRDFVETIVTGWGDRGVPLR